MRRRLIDRLPLSPDRRARVERVLDTVPQRRELADLHGYRLGRERHRLAWDGGYTMLSSRRGRALHRLAQTVDRDRVPGALVDCGVWNGGSSMLLALGGPGRTVWCFDSFEGLPEPDQRDGEESFRYVGDCRGAIEKLREGFDRLAPGHPVEVRKGWFEDTLPAEADAIGPIAVLHCDGDWYESVRLTLETLGPAVSPGGFVVIDDYGTWPGAREATDEYRGRLGSPPRMVKVDHTGYYWRTPR